MGTKPPRAGMGRPKGSKNKTTTAVKEMVLQALGNVGGVKYLEEQATENPTAFMTLVGKVIPLQVGGDEDGVPIRTRIEIAIVDPKGAGS
jgi:hypothetical protein